MIKTIGLLALMACFCASAESLDQIVDDKISAAIAPLQTEITAGNQKNLSQDQRMDLIEQRITALEGVPTIDTDGDGVNDDVDQCPGTTQGVEVDAVGCEIIPPDADGDGIPDADDECPNDATNTCNDPPPATGGVYIVDDSDPGFSVNGTYETTAGAGYKNTYVQVGSYSNKRTVTWQMSNPSGQYDVHVRYIAAWGHSGEAYTVTGHPAIAVDQTVNGDKWVKIATLDLVENVSIVSVSNIYGGANYDAVALTPVGVPVEEPAPVLGLMGCKQYFDAGNTGWCKASDNVIEDVFYDGPLAASIKGSIGPKANIIDWCGAGLDTDEYVKIYRCGGHNDYYGTEIYAHYLLTDTYELLVQPHKLDHYYWSSVFNMYCFVPEPPIPAASHMYDGFAYHPVRKTMIILGYGTNAHCAPDRPAGMTEIVNYDAGGIFEFNHSKTETRAGLAPLEMRKVSDYSPGYQRAEYLNGQLYVGTKYTLKKADFDANNQLVLTDFVSNAASGEGVLSHIGDTLIAYQNGGYLYQWDQNGNLIYSIQNERPPVGSTIVCGDNECLFTAGGKDLSVLNFATSEYELVSNPDGPAENTEPDRVYSKINYLPAFGMYEMLSDYNKPQWYYKHPAPAVAAATTPALAEINVEGQGAFH